MTLRVVAMVSLGVAMVLGYFGYLGGGVWYTKQQVEANRAQAIQKADTNNDGRVGVGEALAVYNALGLSGEAIFGRLYLQDQHNLIIRSLQSVDDNDKQKYLADILELLGTEYKSDFLIKLQISSSTGKVLSLEDILEVIDINSVATLAAYACSNYNPTFTAELNRVFTQRAKRLADINGDVTINVKEAERAFKLIYGNEDNKYYPGMVECKRIGSIRLNEVTLNDYGYILRLFAKPFSLHNGSELERYVKGKY